MVNSNPVMRTSEEPRWNRAAVLSTHSTCYHIPRVDMAQCAARFETWHPHRTPRVPREPLRQTYSSFRDENQ